MSTMCKYGNKDGFDKIKSQIRVTIQTALYGNNVENVKTVSNAYHLAKNSPGTVELTGIPVYQPEKLGLEEGSNALLFNDGTAFGRCAAARRIVGDENVDITEYSAKIREAIYSTRYKKMYHGEVVVGLDPEFMIKAHLIIPEKHENILYSWMLNFQYVNEKYAEMYNNSDSILEGDIIIYADPDWSHPDHPYGLTFFDPEHNCAILLGMKYFGEYKKGTLTLAWGTAARNGYAACHGGIKRYNLEDRKYTISAFGLSGSGKSTITHAKHDNKYDITILHDDAFIIDIENKTSIALEPSYFDKTADYPMGSEDNKFILTTQNNGAIMYTDGKVYPVTEDVRNGNGRAVKSRLWAENRVDKMKEPLDAIFWIMKDPTIPPVLKINGSELGSTMGATLATMRSSAERLAKGIDPNELVAEPYANPFRTYPLSVDYKLFKALIDTGVDCYVINTGHFLDKKVTPDITLGLIESIVEGKAEFKNWGPFDEFEILEIPGYEADLNNREYKEQFKNNFFKRIQFIESKQTEAGGKDKLPNEAVKSLYGIISKLNSLNGDN